MKKPSLLLFFLIFIFLPNYASAAVTQTESQPIKFGNMVVTDPPPQTIVLEPDGDETVSAGITKMSPAQNGVALLGGFTPGAAVTVTLANPETAQTTKSGGSSFDITDFTFDSPGGNYIADGAGTIEVQIGATLTTNTLAASYTDGPYLGTYTLDLLVDY